MLVLKMSEDKTLTVTKRGNTYQDEHNAETIKIILPKLVNSIDLTDCHIYLSFINQEGLGQVIEVSEFIVEYTDCFYSIEIPMHKVFTYKEGNISIWVKILNSEKMMVAKTNVVSHKIKPHIEVEGTIPEQELSILESMAVKLDATSIKVDEVSGRIQAIVDGEEQIVQPMLISSIYEENMNE